MIVKNGRGDIKNTDKPWCIECAYRTEKWSKEGIGYDCPYFWMHNKSYKTFDAVVDAWCALVKGYGKFGCGIKMVYRINTIDFTNYEPLL